MEKDACNETFQELKQALQRFQSNRLNGTYVDLKQNPEFRKIGVFFFEKLYAPEDFSFRDTSMKKLHKLLDGKVYSGMIKAVSMVIELHELSDMLDDRMVEIMMEQGIGTDMTMDQYQDIYRRLDNYDQRVYQIDLSVRVTRAFHRLSKMWIIGISLKTVRMAAHVMGIGKIMDFVHEGYVAFRRIDNIDFFITTMREREMAWHDEIWRGGDGPGESGQ